MIRFTFLDPVDGYIELVLEDMDQVTSQRWKIEPHMEPLIVMNIKIINNCGLILESGTLQNNLMKSLLQSLIIPPFCSLACCIK